jgi:hypothetical protein
MRHRRFSFRRPDSPDPFTWQGFLAALFLSSVAMFFFGLAMDNALRLFGIGISAWQDALWDSCMAFFFGSFVAPLFWRIGLITFPQYLLGAFALVVPITIISVLALSRFHDVRVEVPGIDALSFPDQSFAISAYVRLIRAVIYVPFFLGVFYFIYHVLIGMAPKGHPNG